MWLVGDGDVLLVGSAEPLTPRVSALAEVWARRGEAVADLAAVGARDPFSVVSLLVAEGAGLARFAAGARVLTDDYARVEFSGPRTVFSRGGVDNAAALRALAAEQPVPLVEAARAAAGAASWRDRGWMLIDASSPRAAWTDFETALRLDPHDTRALEGLVRTGAAANRGSETATLLRELAAPSDRLEAQIALSRFLASTGAIPEAAALALAAAERHPSDVAALEQLASIFSDVGDKERLLPVVARLRSVAPTADATRYYSASLLFLDGRTDQAIAEARVLVAANPTHARGHNLLGAALATAGRREAARDAFLASLKAEPHDPSTYTNLGLLELETGNRQSGLQRLAEALLLDPNATSAREAYARESAAGGAH